MKLMFSARAIDRMAGGVERMITRIMSAMVKRGHEVHLLTLDREGAESFYPMVDEIQWYRLNVGDPDQKAGNRIRIKRALKIRKHIFNVRPDVMIGFQDGAFMALSFYAPDLGIPVIAAERNAPTRFTHTNSGWRRQQLTFNAFRLAKSIAVQFESYRSLYPNYLHKKIVNIPNPVDLSNDIAKPEVPAKNERFQLLSVGRLSYQKNYEILIKAFSQIADQFPDWDLVIVGEGEERDRLEQLIYQANLPHRISLPGKTTKISAAYANANLFCLPSLWEGFPNALAEAAAHGLPAVGFAECCGVNELIKNDQTGSLASGNSNPSTLATAIAGLMVDPNKRIAMGSSARNAMKSYTPNYIMNSWEDLFTRSIAS